MVKRNYGLFFVLIVIMLIFIVTIVLKILNLAKCYIANNIQRDFI
jgi:hypothetical protein